MIIMSADFPKWLQGQMDQREWSQSELARRAGVDRQLIWRYLNNITTRPDETVLQKIARALKMPFEEIYRAAGILPPKPTGDEWIEKITHITNQLPPDEKERVFQFAEMLREAIEKKTKQGKRNKKGPTQ